MKRIIYATIALAAVAVGCTKSNIVDVPEAQKTPITFDTYNGRIPVTRAAEITSSDIESIEVIGFHALNNVTKKYMDPTVSRTKKADGSWNNWESDPLYYWPSSGTLEFVAYGSNTKPAADTPNGTLVPITGSDTEFIYTVHETPANQQDLIVGYVPPRDASAGTVSFQMQHLLSRVGFTLMTKGEGNTVTVNKIALHGTFKTTADIDLKAAGTTEDPKLEVQSNSPTVASYTLFDRTVTGDYFATTSSDISSQGVEIYARYNEKVEGGELVTSTSNDNTNRYMMLMPGEVGVNTTTDSKRPSTIGDNPYIEINYQIGTNQAQTKYLPLLQDGEKWNFVSGTAYEFIFTVSVAAIEFEGAVMDWDEDHDGDKNYDSDGDGDKEKDDNIDL